MDTRLHALQEQLMHIHHRSTATLTEVENAEGAKLQHEVQGFADLVSLSV